MLLDFCYPNTRRLSNTFLCQCQLYHNIISVYFPILPPNSPSSLAIPFSIISKQDNRRDPTQTIPICYPSHLVCVTKSIWGMIPRLTTKTLCTILFHYTCSALNKLFIFKRRTCTRFHIKCAQCGRFRVALAAEHDLALKNRFLLFFNSRQV